MAGLQNRRLVSAARSDYKDMTAPLSKSVHEAWARPPSKKSRNDPHNRPWEGTMAESVYKVLELIGTSTKSWEDAAMAAVRRASRTLRDLRVAEVVEQDLVITNGKVEAFRAKLKVSFKFEDETTRKKGR
jgi:flavin-binding protein dodecin